MKLWSCVPRQVVASLWYSLLELQGCVAVHIATQSLLLLWRRLLLLKPCDLILQFGQQGVSRLAPIPRGSWLGGRLCTPATPQGEGERLRLKLAEAANGVQDQSGFRVAGEGAGRAVGKRANAVVAGR